MTAYSCVFFSTKTGDNTNVCKYLAVRAGSWPVRVMSVETNGGHAGVGQANSAVDLSRYETSTISGGSTLTPQPMREGALPCTATARYRPATVISGTPSTLSLGSAVTVTGTKRFLKRRLYIAPASEENSWQPPTEIIVASGSTFFVEADPAQSNAYLAYVVVWFEELRLTWST